MLTVVGVGPGDPELITLKAVRLLQAADRIALPSSGRPSMVWPVIAPHIQKTPLLSLFFPMRGSEEDWRAAHQQAAARLLLHLHENLVYPILGDPSLYGGIAYLMDSLPRDQVRIVPGVPAMCAAAAHWKVPLASGKEGLTVLGAFEEGDRLPPGNVVVMKTPASFESVREQAGSRPGYLSSRMGFEDERHALLSEAEPPLPYMTTMIVKE